MRAGVIRAALDGSGKAANTLLLLSADNGPWNVKCSLTGSQGPFLGSWAKDPKNGVPEGKSATGKFTTWEAGHREPFIAYMPGEPFLHCCQPSYQCSSDDLLCTGRIAKRSVSHVLASTMDFMPTLAALAGVALPTDRQAPTLRPIQSIASVMGGAHR